MARRATVLSALLLCLVPFSAAGRHHLSSGSRRHGAGAAASLGVLPERFPQDKADQFYKDRLLVRRNASSSTIVAVPSGSGAPVTIVCAPAAPTSSASATSVPSRQRRQKPFGGPALAGRNVDMAQALKALNVDASLVESDACVITGVGASPFFSGASNGTSSMGTGPSRSTSAARQSEPTTTETRTVTTTAVASSSDSSSSSPSGSASASPASSTLNSNSSSVASPLTSTPSSFFTASSSSDGGPSSSSANASTATLVSFAPGPVASSAGTRSRGASRASRSASASSTQAGLTSDTVPTTASFIKK